MDQKVRDRSKKELHVRKMEFLKICDVLDDLKINYFLSSGILLGAIRDNDFIKWDWDIEISVFANEFLPKIDLVSDKLKKSGFKITKITKLKSNSKIDFTGIYPSEVTSYTIYAWQYSAIKNVYRRKEFVIPSKFLKNLAQIKFLDRQFNCPNNYKEYLTFVYGNWKKPLRTSNKNVYLSKDFKKDTFFFSIYVDKFITKICNYFKMIKKFQK